MQGQYLRVRILTYYSGPSTSLFTLANHPFRVVSLVGGPPFVRANDDNSGQGDRRSDEGTAVQKGGGKCSQRSREHQQLRHRINCARKMENVAARTYWHARAGRWVYCKRKAAQMSRIATWTRAGRGHAIIDGQAKGGGRRIWAWRSYKTTTK